VQVWRLKETPRETVTAPESVGTSIPTDEVAPNGTAANAEMRIVCSLSVCPESVTTWICSRHRQFGQSFLMVFSAFCGQQVSAGSFAQQDSAFAGTEHAIFPVEDPETDFPVQQLWSFLVLQQHGMRDAGNTVTPTRDMHEIMMIKRLSIKTCLFGQIH
jgi:hypothetical protein